MLHGTLWGHLRLERAMTAEKVRVEKGEKCSQVKAQIISNWFWHFSCRFMWAPMRAKMILCLLLMVLFGWCLASGLVSIKLAAANGPARFADKSISESLIAKAFGARFSGQGWSWPIHAERAANWGARQNLSRQHCLLWGPPCGSACRFLGPSSVAELDCQCPRRGSRPKRTHAWQESWRSNWRSNWRSWVGFEELRPWSISPGSGVVSSNECCKQSTPLAALASSASHAPRVDAHPPGASVLASRPGQWRVLQGVVCRTFGVQAKAKELSNQKRGIAGPDDRKRLLAEWTLEGKLEWVRKDKSGAYNLILQRGEPSRMLHEQLRRELTGCYLFCHGCRHPLHFGIQVYPDRGPLARARKGGGKGRWAAGARRWWLSPPSYDQGFAFIHSHSKIHVHPQFTFLLAFSCHLAFPPVLCPFPLCPARLPDVALEFGSFGYVPGSWSEAQLRGFYRPGAVSCWASFFP